MRTVDLFEVSSLPTVKGMQSAGDEGMASLVLTQPGFPSLPFGQGFKPLHYRFLHPDDARHPSPNIRHPIPIITQKFSVFLNPGLSIFDPQFQC
ncbi:MAG: hypothetical protein B6I19_02340 [Bacteroidetes bacterium 4572_114]|nr:MAG: hypothetical protein B6I19_02340 [Bacteroidetes bacterium 4572_114]